MRPALTQAITLPRRIRNPFRIKKNPPPNRTEWVGTVHDSGHEE